MTKNSDGSIIMNGIKYIENSTAAFNDWGKTYVLPKNTPFFYKMSVEVDISNNANFSFEKMGFFNDSDFSFKVIGKLQINDKFTVSDNEEKSDCLYCIVFISDRSPVDFQGDTVYDAWIPGNVLANTAKNN